MTMTKTFEDTKYKIVNLFREGTKFKYHNTEYEVLLAGNPVCTKGNPKTDIYISAKSIDNQIKEFKILLKKQNSDFLEPQINAERAEQLFGTNWSDILSAATLSLSEKIHAQKLIYKSTCGGIGAGAITLGWELEVLSTQSGQLSDKLKLNRTQLIDIYAGTNLTGEKRDASVNGKTIKESGIANYVFCNNSFILSAQRVMDSLCTIEEYVDKNPSVYFVCKELNYKSLEQTYEANRSLVVYVDWYVRKGKLAHTLCFRTPLQQGNDFAYQHLQTALGMLGVKDTNDLEESNVEDIEIIYP